MGLAEAFSDTLHEQLQVYAAWFPVVNTIKVGDFGLIESGVFRSMGNVSKFGIEVVTASGKDADIDFVSEGTTVTRFVAGGKVDRFPPVGDLEAKLELEFTRDNSCMIKAKLSVIEMQDIHGVAKKLKDLNNWDNDFKVVSCTYSGEKCVVLACREAGTKVSFTGKANILQGVDLGKVELGPSFESTSNACFKSIGETGVVGIRLFQLGFFGGPKLLGKEGRKSAQIKAEMLTGKLKNDL
ncbi:MAG: hypothetical protein H8K07_08570 [Nitrospira sp.]|jgi:hypothetical protein|nr:hypothetical protein [Nitrospira sp.]MDI3467130.1 hypothetical protein [Nitrospira sp.]